MLSKIQKCVQQRLIRCRPPLQKAGCVLALACAAMPHFWKHSDVLLRWCWSSCGMECIYRFPQSEECAKVLKSGLAKVFECGQRLDCDIVVVWI
ncbi:hypothetical protein DL95DRAFT_88106 [Leptodontidium sp. 2 PMI_412]|nr:hypothetical protein DL95DRAFT_88106 [Leptodontidium sp. 2 PMI_412]